MPGISGIISKANKRSHEIDMDMMLSCMVQEASYTTGRYINKHLGLYVGWVSRKNSFSDCMPIWNEKKDVCLFFSGEEFSDQDRFNQLMLRGHEFDSYNASYLIHCYEEKGEKFINKLNGMFHGVIVDVINNKVVLFNDRYGLKRIYFHETDDAFYFSYQAKSLLKIFPKCRSINYQNLGEYISLGCVLDNKTLFLNIYLLPSGSKWTFINRHIKKKETYFEPSYLENKPILDTDTYSKKLMETFARILPRYFRSRDSIGMSLTGGLDTRMIMAYLGFKQSQMPCYTFGSMYRDCADVKVARKVADACDLPHQVIRLGKEFLSCFQGLAERTVYITDGSLDVSGSAELYANMLAKNIAPIRMTGNYGSEVLRCNVAFKPTLPCANLFHPEFYKHIQNAGKLYNYKLRGHPLSFILSNQVPWHHYGRFALEQSQLTVRSPFLDNELVELVYQAPHEVNTGGSVSHRIIENRNPRLSQIMTDRGIRGSSHFITSIVAKIIQEFTFKAEYFYDYGMPHWVAKLDHIFKSIHLERLFLGRHKYYHFRIWYRDELSDYVRDILLDRKSSDRAYLDKYFLNQIVNGHVKGDHNYTIEINKLITIELIHRLFIDG